MPDPFSVDFNQDQSNGHPHDLLARLYREIGISAVAAALQATHFTGEPAKNLPVGIDRQHSTSVEDIKENIAA